MSINWVKFAERVPAGCMIRYRLDSWISGERLEGILIENKPYSGQEWIVSRIGDTGEETTRLKCQPFYNPFHLNPNRVPVKNISFLVNDRWLTFDEIMRD